MATLELLAYMKPSAVKIWTEVIKLLTDDKDIAMWKNNKGAIKDQCCLK